MHFYKRDLSPVNELFSQCNEKTPFKPNFQNYQGSLMSKNFKDEILSNLGEGIRCQSANC